MIGFYVIMIAVLAMSAAVGYTILTSVQTSNALSLAERNASRLEMTASALRQVVIADADGRLFVPMGVPSITGAPTSRTGLPDWVSGEAITPWGADYAYCPFAPVAKAGGSASTVYGGTNYAVTVSSDPVVYGASRDYVYSGARPSNALDIGPVPDVLAFLISPSNNLSTVGACDDVYWDGRAWLLSGIVTGSVRALTLDSLADSLSQAPRVLRRHVVEAGTGSGLTSGDPASFETVLSEWRYLRPSRLTVVLDDAGGDLLIDPTGLDFGAGVSAAAPHPDAFGRHLILEAESGANPVLDSSIGGSWLRFPADLTLNGVDFGPDLGLALMSGSRALIKDSALSALDTGGGTVVLGGGVSVTAPTGSTEPPVLVSGGELSIEGATTLDATESGGSAIRQRGGRVRVDAALTVTTGGGADLFEADGYGEVSSASSGSLDLNTAGAVVMTPYTSTTLITSGTDCTTGDLTCAVTCPDARVVLSGSCAVGGASNIFLQGGAISGEVFTCSWGQVTETNPDYTEPALPHTDPAYAPSGPVSPVASALCAPKR